MALQQLIPSGFAPDALVREEASISQKGDFVRQGGGYAAEKKLRGWHGRNISRFSNMEFDISPWSRREGASVLKTSRCPGWGSAGMDTGDSFTTMGYVWNQYSLPCLPAMRPLMKSKLLPGICASMIYRFFQFHSSTLPSP